MPAEQARSQQRHARILDAALRVFSRQGFHLTAVDDIAGEARTSKGGVYFHFPTKQAIFLALLDRMAGLLRARVQAAVAGEADPLAKADIALQVVLQTFASHRTLARLFFVEALGAGPEFHRRMLEIRGAFVALIQEHLDEAARQGAIPPLDTAAASRVWFGALSEVVTSWVLAEPPGRLEESYPTVRALLLRGIGAQVPAPEAAPSAPHARSRSVPAVGVALGAAGPGTDLAGCVRPVLEEAARRARADGRPVLASVVVPAPPSDPLAFFRRGAALGPDRAVWSRPRTGFSLAAVGGAWSIEGRAERRFQQTATAWQDILRDAVVRAPADVIGVGPALMGGFAFETTQERPTRWDGYPDGRLILPRCLLTHVDGAAWLTTNVLISPEGDTASETEALVRAASVLLREPDANGPVVHEGVAAEVVDELPAAAWQRSVRSMVARIRAGEIEKAVLARGARARSGVPFDVPLALARLRRDYPSCFVFAVVRGDRCFLGASPERLVRLRDGVVSTMCLAGSTARGTTDEEDRRLGEALLASPKERAEHEVVVRALQEALAEVCDGVAPISTPVLLKVRNVQHLLTTIVGRAVDGASILDVVERLHPTPAVGGYPREAALAAIRQEERLDRGWYAGPVGWLDAGGEGEFAVAIRSGLVSGREASLFAGCGIMGDSDPDAEYAEAWLKLRPMLSALGADTP